jgi:hypothetical protein
LAAFGIVADASRGRVPLLSGSTISTLSRLRARTANGFRRRRRKEEDGIKSCGVLRRGEGTWEVMLDVRRQMSEKLLAFSS